MEDLLTYQGEGISTTHDGCSYMADGCGSRVEVRDLKVASMTSIESRRFGEIPKLSIEFLVGKK